jgi:hypothetical protein
MDSALLLQPLPPSEDHRVRHLQCFPHVRSSIAIYLDRVLLEMLHQVVLATSRASLDRQGCDSSTNELKVGRIFSYMTANLASIRGKLRGAGIIISNNIGVTFAA